MSNERTGLIPAILAALLLAATTASAQSPGGPGGGTWPGGPGGQSGRGGQGGMGTGGAGRGPMGATDASPGAARNDVATTVRFRLELLQEDLKLASSQRALWTAYADRVLKLLDDLSRSRSVTRIEDRPAPQQLDQLADTARNRLAAVEDIVEAGKALYAVLTPEQKTLADTRFVTVVRPLLDGTTTMPGRAGPAPPGPQVDAPEKSRSGR